MGLLLINNKSKIGYIIITGQIAWNSGTYAYMGHADGIWHPECIINDKERIINLKEDQVAPKLGSCKRNVNWMLISRMDENGNYKNLVE